MLLHFFRTLLYAHGRDETYASRYKKEHFHYSCIEFDNKIHS